MNKQENNSKFPFVMTLKSLIIYVIAIIVMGLFLFFIRGDCAGKITACTVCPGIILYLMYAFYKERKADSKADDNEIHFVDGSYFESQEWHEKYLLYLNEHPFKKPECQSMKRDLLKRFRRREYIVGILLSLFLIFCTAFLITLGRYSLAIVGFIIFGLLFYMEFSMYIGMPVRRWLKKNDNNSSIESSYLNSQMLLYKINGLSFGTTYIHAFTEKNIYAIEYDLVKGISRNIVRLKKYKDGIYSTEEYKFYAVIHAIQPQSSTIHDIEIELNEYQVQMAIDKLTIYKLGKEMNENLTVDEQKENA